MRDKRCNKKLLEEEIIYEHGKINSTIEFIEEAEKEFGEEYNSYTTSGDIIRRELNVITYKYTLGFDLQELYKEYSVIVEHVRKLDCVLHAYEATRIVALGILFEDGIERFQHLINLMDKERKNDILFDYLINGCGFRREKCSKKFFYKLFQFSTELIELAQKDRGQASKKLVHHLKTKWNNPKKPDFKGYWIWEYGAISKMFKLDDSELKDNPHYPYELVHYKNEMEFTPEKMLDFPEENYKKGIPEYKVLEKIIPVKFHEITNNLLVDFKILSDEEFYEKYDIDHVTHYLWKVEDYIKRKNEPYLLGILSVFKLIDSGYVVAISSPEEIEEYTLYNFWEDIEDIEVKAVNFNVDNGNYYLAYIPKDVQIDSILDVKIENVKDLREFDKYKEEF